MTVLFVVYGLKGVLLSQIIRFGLFGSKSFNYIILKLSIRTVPSRYFTR